jgi:hypothetical protein
MASTHLLPGLQTRKQTAGIATMALVGVAYFVVAIIVLHFLRPDLNPIQRPTSEYAVGPYAWLMTSAFFSLSAASWALIIGLYQGVAQPARSRIGLGLLGVWAVGLLIAMLFPTDPGGVALTITGMIHQSAGPPTFLSLTAGMILVSWRFKQSEKWRPFHRPALILSAVFLLAFVATFLSFVTGSGLLGLAQRIALATAVVWISLTATRLRSMALGPVSA